MNDFRSRIIVALDFPEPEAALRLGRALVGEVGMLKVGLELFNLAGPSAIEELRRAGARVFYDAKLHDIPNTVAGAAAAAGRMGVSMLNVHALGGRAMMEAAKDAARRGASEAGFPPPLVIGVTVLTSLADRDATEVGIAGDASDAVLRLASLAKQAGLDGVVAAVAEVSKIKRVCGTDFVTVTPGIRPSWAERGDQARTATPQEAVASGTDYVVIGRPVTRAADPVDAVARIVREVAD